MTVGDQDSRPPAVVKVIELHSPSQPRLDVAQSGAVGDVVKVVVAAVKVQSGSVIAEIRFDDILITTVHEVVCGKTHARLFGSVLVVRHGGLPADFCKRTVLVIVK